MKTKQHTKNYPDFNVACEICGEHFKTPQGLSGHKQFKHGINAVIAGEAKPGPLAGPGDQSVKELKGEVERLELELKRRKLQAEFPSTAARHPDIMEQSGLGSLEGESKMLAQKRAMGVGQEQHQGWIDKIISNPEALKLAIAGLRGVLGVDSRGNGDNSLKILSDLGFDLKSLIQGANSPKAGALSIAGVSLEGANLTPELLQSILSYKSAEVKAKADFEGRKEMADGLKNVLQLIGKGLGESMGKPGPGRIISQEINRQQPQSQKFSAECPSCHFSNVIEGDVQIGSTIKCQGKLADGQPCSESWVVSDPDQERKQERKQRPEKKLEVQEPPKSVACENCGQLLNVEGATLGSELLCPVCQKVMVLTSPDIPLDPGPAEDADPYKLRDSGGQRFLHGR